MVQSRGMAFWSVVVPAGMEVISELDNEEDLAQVRIRESSRL